ncbi:EcsC family protein [Paenibacillus thailandensis]|uniref:EcsC family protein n=1 Tax=Paenibacillus thailandensis TaxID=393250 RepID=A0ABW5R3L9_9BACL
METKEQLTAILADIEAWEKDQKDLWFIEKLGRLPFQLLDKITPKLFHQKLGQALDELGGYIQNGGRYLVSVQSVLTKLKRKRMEMEGLAPADGVPITIEEAAKYPIAIMKQTSSELTASRTTIATVQGATTGFGGMLTLAIDIPALIGLSLKVIQEIAVCYGYDPNKKEERVFAVKVLQFASSDIVGKKAILDSLSHLSGEHGERPSGMMSELQGWREVMTTYVDNYGWKKLFQLIPVAGMVFGAVINRGMLSDVAEAADRLYCKRRILERLTERGNHARQQDNAL